MDPQAPVAGPLPFPGDDPDLDGHLDWLVGEIDAGRQQVPPEWAVEGPAISISLGDACDIDPELLAAMCGPEGLGGQSARATFGQDESADVLPPGPVLAVLTAQMAARAESLTEDELTGVLQAGRRLAAWADYQQTVAIAEFARRRQAQYDAAKSAGKPVGLREGEFPGAELAMELVETGAYAGTRIDTAIELTSRLPRTLAGMANGTIDLGRAMTIAVRTQSMTDADAAYADEILAAAAPGKRPDQLARKAAALEMKLAPEAVQARREVARQLDQRVEVRREESGNASLAARELDTAQAMASKAYIDAVAAQLRAAGVGGTLGQLRAQVLTDVTQGRDPLDRIRLADPGPESAVPAPADPGPAPLPALINLLVPVATLLGWGTAPAHADGWGLLDAEETRSVVQAASRHPRTRWCMTITAPDGTAIAHGCASGQRPQETTTNDLSPPQAAQLSDLLRRLNITLEPVARDACGHAHAEDRYVPSRKLTHLIRARTQACTAPGCNAQAVRCDLDHTVPYPHGPTCECNLSPKCRRHHRTKQAPGWQVTQPAPDTTAWTTPSGRTHVTTATEYDG